MTEQAKSISASWVEGYFSSRIFSFRNWCSQDKLRSMNQRVLPKPLPWAVRRLASKGFTPFFWPPGDAVLNHRHGLPALVLAGNVGHPPCLSQEECRRAMGATG